MKKRCGDIASLLRSCGLKYTRSREVILIYLKSAKQPAHAEQIYTELKERGSSVNLSTVYRTLESLCEAGLANKVVFEESGKALYEYSDSTHRHHLVCVGCKKITPISSCPLAEYEQALEGETGYEITGHRLNVYGYCPECRKD